MAAETNIWWRRAKLGTSYALHSWKVHGIRGMMNFVENVYSMMAKPLYVQSSPFFIYVEPTINCNLRCMMCDLSVRTRDRKVRDLTLNNFKRIVKQFPLLDRVHLQGMGEPLLNPGFFEMVKCCENMGIAVSTFTNGTLITADIAKEIVSSGLEELWISVDGATAETYEDIRSGASFDKVIQNIELIVSACNARKANQLRLGLWFVAMERNIHELPLLVELGAKLGVKKICVERADHWGKEMMKTKLDKERLKLDYKYAIGYVQAALKKARQTRIALQLEEHLVHFLENGNRRHITCWWPWWSCFITVDGHVTPCCSRPDHKVFNFGNIFKQSFKTIWNSPQYVHFRAMLSSGKPLTVCKDCWRAKAKSSGER